MNILDLLFPRTLYCACCGRPLPPSLGSGGTALCERCADEIKWVSGRRCEKCGKPLDETNPRALCGDCALTARVFGKGYACARYEGRAAELVRDMKYRGKAWYADTIAELMAIRFLDEIDPETGEFPLYDFFVSAPMSGRKKAARGYDQAELIARRLAGLLAVPYAKDALRRVRETDVMSALSADERRQNLAAAFALSCDMIQIAAGKRFLLIDDVYTTGSTVDACASALLAAGAETVDVAVFAIGADVRRREKDRPAVIASPGQLRAKGPT